MIASAERPSSVYVDTSALGRVLLDEPGADAAEAALGGFERKVSSRLLAVELRRLALRASVAPGAERLLLGIALVPVDETVLGTAETLGPANVAALDAIHLATALRLAEQHAIDALLTYDRRLADGARHHGLRVLTPGQVSPG